MIFYVQLEYFFFTVDELHMFWDFFCASFLGGALIPQRGAWGDYSLIFQSYCHYPRVI